MKVLTVLLNDSVSLPCDIATAVIEQNGGQPTGSLQNGGRNLGASRDTFGSLNGGTSRSSASNRNNGRERNYPGGVEASAPVIFLWYRGDSPEPFYSYDLRAQAEGRHWSDAKVFGRRAHFSLSPSYRLRVSGIRATEAGVYRCRVDYETGPSKTTGTQLRVVVLPSAPVITDEAGVVVRGAVGPYMEKGRLVLTCKTMGGFPSPTLVWLREGQVVEDSYNGDRQGQVRNLLHLENLSRDMLDATFTCRASNSNITQPLDASIVINMTLAPLTIKLSKASKGRGVEGKEEDESFVRGGVLETLNCQTTGSRPPPVVTWWRDGQQLPDKPVKVVEPNMTVSSLSLRPTPEDHGVVVTCRVENPALPGSVLEESYKLNVHYVPITTLRVGLRLNPGSVREGSDLYFECSIQANPPAHKMVFLHKNHTISPNINPRVIVSNQTLVLQRVSREQAGPYSCAATNTRGRGVSDPLSLHVLYAPVCQPMQQIEYQVLRHKTVNISCTVDAQPNNVTFTWLYNNTGTLLDVGEGRSTSIDNVSILRYTPTSPADYGTLLCSAKNVIGEQNDPCVISVTASKLPDLVSDCRLRAQTSTAVVVTCVSVPSELPTTYYMEVRHFEELQFVKRVSNTTPYFVADGLSPGTDYTLHVSVTSPMGNSTPIELQAFTVKTAEKRMELSDASAPAAVAPPASAPGGGASLSPLMVTVSVVLAGAVVVAVVVLTVVVRCAHRRRRRRGTADDTEIIAGGSRSSGGSQYSPSSLQRGGGALLLHPSSKQGSKYTPHLAEGGSTVLLSSTTSTANIAGGVGLMRSPTDGSLGFPTAAFQQHQSGHQQQQVTQQPIQQFHHLHQQQIQQPHHQHQQHQPQQYQQSFPIQQHQQQQAGKPSSLQQQHQSNQSVTQSSLSEERNPDVIPNMEGSRDYQLEELRVPSDRTSQSRRHQPQQQQQATHWNSTSLAPATESIVSTILTSTAADTSSCHQYYHQHTLPRQRLSQQQQQHTRQQQNIQQCHQRSRTPPPNLCFVSKSCATEMDSSIPLPTPTYTPPEGFMEGNMTCNVSSCGKSHSSSDQVQDSQPNVQVNPNDPMNRLPSNSGSFGLPLNVLESSSTGLGQTGRVSGKQTFSGLTCKSSIGSSSGSASPSPSTGAYGIGGGGVNPLDIRNPPISLHHPPPFVVEGSCNSPHQHHHQTQQQQRAFCPQPCGFTHQQQPPQLQQQQLGSKGAGGPHHSLSCPHSADNIAKSAHLQSKVSNKPSQCHQFQAGHGTFAHDGSSRDSTGQAQSKHGSPKSSESCV